MKINQQANLLFKNKLRGSILSALFFLSFFSANSQQNLVPNNCFETYSSCPNAGGQINLATGWVNAAPVTSPDYFNSCATYTTFVSAPSNAFGYQNDYAGGSGYAGIWVFNGGFPNDAREYIEIELSDTLTAGKKYLVGMYVSLSQNYDYGISAMGMAFTSATLFAPVGKGFINIPNPQVKNTTPLLDTLNWMLVQDTVTGTGTEMFLTIGNFSYDSLCDTIFTNNAGGSLPGAYYFVDNVFVIDAAFAGINENVKENEIKIYPNPAKDQISISCPKCNNALLPVAIYDVTGKLISAIKLNLNDGVATFDLDVENGVYFVKIGENENQSTSKLIIQK